MFASYVGMTEIDRGLNYWLCLVLSIFVGLLFGGFTERVLIRPLYGKPEINAIVVTVGFLGVLEAVAQADGRARRATSRRPFPRSISIIKVDLSSCRLSSFSNLP